MKTPELSKHAKAILAGAVADRDELAAREVSRLTVSWCREPVEAARDFNEVRLAPAAWLGRELTPSDYVLNCRVYRQLAKLGFARRVAYEGSSQTSFLAITEAGLELGRRLLAKK